MDKLNNDNSDCLKREITKDSDNDDDDRAITYVTAGSLRNDDSLSSARIGTSGYCAVFCAKGPEFGFQELPQILVSA